jgi:hypothetical protein
MACGREEVSQAFDKLAVGKLLSPENLIHPDCDAHSMVAYAEHFRETPTLFSEMKSSLEAVCTNP